MDYQDRITGMKSLLLSFKYAYAGLATAFRTERNLKIHGTITVCVLIAGIAFKLTALEWCIILLTIGLMMVTELLNTAIERTVDLVTKEFHPLAKQAKDISAGACFFSALISVIIGLVLFLPKIASLIFGPNWFPF